MVKTEFKKGIVEEARKKNIEVRKNFLNKNYKKEELINLIYQNKSKVLSFSPFFLAKPDFEKNLKENLNTLKKSNLIDLIIKIEKW